MVLLKMVNLVIEEMLAAILLMADLQDPSMRTSSLVLVELGTKGLEMSDLVKVPQQEVFGRLQRTRLRSPQFEVLGKIAQQYGQQELLFENWRQWAVTIMNLN